MTNLKKLLSANLKIYRNACGLSQAKLAEKVDTATNYIASIEAGRRFPSVKILEKLASALGIDTPELFSMAILPLHAAKMELEEQVWLDVGQKIDEFVEENLNSLKKKKNKR